MSPPPPAPTSGSAWWKARLFMTPLPHFRLKPPPTAVCILSEALATCLYCPQSPVSREDFKMGPSDQWQPICRLVFIPCTLLISRLEGSRWELWREEGSRKNPKMGYFLPEQMNQCLRKPEANLSQGAEDSGRDLLWKMKTLLIDLWPESSKLICLIAPKSAVWGGIPGASRATSLCSSHLLRSPWLPLL